MPEELLEHGTSEAKSNGSADLRLTEFKLVFGDGGPISTNYQLQDRLLTACEPLILPGAFLKCYSLRAADEPIPEPVAREAQALITEKIANGEIAVDYGVGFAVLQQDATEIALIVGSWHETREFREAVYRRDLAAGTSFERVRTGDDTPHPIWDLAPLWQERQAWARYLFPNRARDTRQAYLSEFLSSAV